MRDEPLSILEKNFALEALQAGIRVDGRKVDEARLVDFEFSSTQHGTVTVRLGKTKVLSSVTAEVVEPTADRPAEGFVTFSVDLSPMASEVLVLEYLSSGRSSSTLEEASEIVRFLQQLIRESNAIDTETLCIVAGVQVWAIRVDIHVLDHGGNVLDACCMAALASLLHMRRPDVTIVGNDVFIHSIEEREPIALTIHHLPISVSFGIFSDGDLVAVDPNLQEESVMEGTLSIAVNAHKEVCAFRKAGGAPMETTAIFKCASSAYLRATEVTMQLEKALSKTNNIAIASVKPLEVETTKKSFPLNEHIEGVTAVWKQVAEQQTYLDNEKLATPSHPGVINKTEIENSADESDDEAFKNSDDLLSSTDSDEEMTMPVIARPKGGKVRSKNRK
jgi:exosome complex component RRP45